MCSHSSDFLEDSTVQYIRTHINDSTTYPALFVRPSHFGIPRISKVYPELHSTIRLGTFLWMITVPPHLAAANRRGGVVLLTMSEPYPSTSLRNLRSS